MQLYSNDKEKKECPSHGASEPQDSTAGPWKSSSNNNNLLSVKSYTLVRNLSNSSLQSKEKNQGVINDLARHGCLSSSQKLTDPKSKEFLISGENMIIIAYLKIIVILTQQTGPLN